MCTHFTICMHCCMLCAQKQHHDIEKLEKEIQEYKKKLKEQESCHEAQITEVYKENQKLKSQLENKISQLEGEI